MKTAHIMIRKFHDMDIRQNHKTGMFNANDLHKIANTLNTTQKQLNAYFTLGSTKKLIKELCALDNVEAKDIKTARRGSIKGGTWLSPELFVDFAMWLSPKFKAQVLRWVVDELLHHRDNSGDSYKEMFRVLKQLFPLEFNDVRTYTGTANRIAAACKVGLAPNKWEIATKEQLAMREKIQETIITIAEFCPNTTECVSRAINKVIKVNL